ncbi:MAG: hypothetical protein IPG81_12550 [Sandaracinaceae bacterium]|nr:hypothetical protein [Sandaracinaceae bacterium]
MSTAFTARPCLPVELQLVLALKVLCGFRASHHDAAVQMRGPSLESGCHVDRDALAARGIDLDTPPDVAARLVTVQAVLYLLFNEGYSASRGDALLRGELCEEALRLGYLLLAHEARDAVFAGPGRAVPPPHGALRHARGRHR